MQKQLWQKSAGSFYVVLHVLQSGWASLGLSHSLSGALSGSFIRRMRRQQTHTDARFCVLACSCVCVRRRQHKQLRRRWQPILLRKAAGCASVLLGSVGSGSTSEPRTSSLSPKCRKKLIEFQARFESKLPKAPRIAASLFLVGQIVRAIAITPSNARSAALAVAHRRSSSCPLALSRPLFLALLRCPSLSHSPYWWCMRACWWCSRSQRRRRRCQRRRRRRNDGKISLRCSENFFVRFRYLLFARWRVDNKKRYTVRTKCIKRTRVQRLH